MKLYSCEAARGPKPVRVVLALLRINYTLIEVNLAAEEQFGSAFTAINPNQRVPALDLTGHGKVEDVLTQSGAIMEYFAELCPKAQLLGEGTLERFRVREIMRLLDSDLRPLGNRQPLLRLMQEAHYTSRAETNGWSIFWVGRAFDALERMLKLHQSDPDFCVGERLTLADITLGTEVWAAISRFSLPVSEKWPKIWGVYEHLCTLPAFRTVHGLNG